MIDEKIVKIIDDAFPALESWIVEDEGSFKMLDYSETAYSENYSAGNAAVIFAFLYKRHNDEKYLDLSHKMLRRGVECCQDDSVAVFTKIFIVNYSLIALSILYKDQLQEIPSEYKDYYRSFRDDIEPFNINCAALQLAIELLRDMLEIKSSDAKYCGELLEFIQSAQNAKGFINDSVGKVKGVMDGQPIAYHNFILFILTSALSCGRYLGKKNDCAATIEDIVRRGFIWLKNAATSNGFFAMAGRSREQVFTWGTFAAVVSYCSENRDFLEKTLDYWMEYKEDDGSYCCTPNYLNLNFRAGFEGYTRNNMYNCLALTGMAIAGVNLENKFSLGEELKLEDGCFIDYESGYAFAREKENFIGLTLRCHEGGSMPAMHPFHVMINGAKTIIPEAKVTAGDVNNGLFEGVCLRKENATYYPSSNKNIGIEISGNRISMDYSDENFTCSKQIELSSDAITYKYNVTTKKDFDLLKYHFPILLFDGKDRLVQVETEKNLFGLDFAGKKYSLSFSGVEESYTSLQRFLSSTSGLATFMECIIKNNVVAGERFRFEIQLKTV